MCIRDSVNAKPLRSASHWLAHRQSLPLAAARCCGQKIAAPVSYTHLDVYKRQELGLEWHLIGHLQSNKAEAAARAFGWVQTVDRAKLVAALARHRPAHLPPLNVLIQINIDDEASKHGCQPCLLYTSRCV